jgi:heptosyltransferase-3
MPRTYSRTKVMASLAVELAAGICLWPLLLVSRLQKRKTKNILLVEPFQMGDALSLTPMIAPLLVRFPDARIFVLTKQGSGAILKLDKRLAGVFSADFPWADHGVKNFSWQRVFSVARSVWKLRSQKFYLGIDTRGDIRSQILLVLAGCRLRAGYTNYLQSNINQFGLLLSHTVRKSSFVHRFEWNLHALTVLRIPPESLLPVQFPTFFPEVETFECHKPYLLIHVGGGWEYRRWSEEKWIALIKELIHTVDYDIKVVGGSGEQEIVTRMEARVEKSVRVSFCITSLTQLVQHVQASLFFIGLDSGPMNLAACLNKPVVALFGPGDVNVWRPLPAGSRVVRKTDRFPCSPCLQIHCFFPEHNCMAEIEVSDVMKAVREATTALV